MNKSISGDMDPSVKRGVTRGRPRRRPARRFVVGIALVAVVAAAGLASGASGALAQAAGGNNQGAGQGAGARGKKAPVDSEDRAVQRLQRATQRVKRLRKKVRKAEEAVLKSEPGHRFDAALAAEEKAWNELFAAKKELKKARKATLGGQFGEHEQRLKNEWKLANEFTLKACKQLDRCSKPALKLVRGFLKVHVLRIEKLRKSLKDLEKRLWKWRKGWFRGGGAAGKRREDILAKIDQDLRVSMGLIARQAAKGLDTKGRPGTETDAKKVEFFSLINQEFKIFWLRDPATIARYKRWKRLQLRLRILDALAARRMAELERFIRKVEAKIGKGEKKDAPGKSEDKNKGKPEGKNGVQNDALRSFVPHLPAIHPTPKPGMTPPMEPRFPAPPPELMGPR
jgi:hypothetical protein